MNAVRDLGAAGKTSGFTISEGNGAANGTDAGARTHDWLLSCSDAQRLQLELPAVQRGYALALQPTLTCLAVRAWTGVHHLQGLPFAGAQVLGGSTSNSGEQGIDTLFGEQKTVPDDHGHAVQHALLHPRWGNALLHPHWGCSTSTAGWTRCPAHRVTL
jgi:hypothetical protein